MHKYDKEYARQYYLKNKEKVLGWTKKWTEKNKDKVRNYHKEWARKNKERLRILRERPENKQKIKKRAAEYYQRVKHTKRFIERKLKDRILYQKRHPLRAMLAKRLSLIRQRCKNPKYRGYKYYGGRGIKCFLFLRDMIYLWERDRAHLMKKASIDRIDPDGHYELSNCQFIEMRENRIKRDFDRIKN